MQWSSVSTAPQLHFPLLKVVYEVLDETIEPGEKR